MYSTLRLAPFAFIFFLNSCSPILLGVPTVVDEKLERYVSEIGLEIVAVSEHRHRRANYQFRARRLCPPRYFRFEYRQAANFYQLRVEPASVS